MIAFSLWIEKLKNREVQLFSAGVAKEEANLGETRARRLQPHTANSESPGVFGTWLHSRQVQDGEWTNVRKAPVSKELTA